MQSPSRASSRALPAQWCWSDTAYGGAVISNAVEAGANVKALVFVAAFAPDRGETCAELSGRYPGGTLGAALA